MAVSRAQDRRDFRLSMPINDYRIGLSRRFVGPSENAEPYAHHLHISSANDAIFILHFLFKNIVYPNYWKKN